MVPDRQKVWTDGRCQNYIPPTSSGDNKHNDRVIGWVQNKERENNTMICFIDLFNEN